MKPTRPIDDEYIAAVEAIQERLEAAIFNERDNLTPEERLATIEAMAVGLAALIAGSMNSEHVWNQVAGRIREIMFEIRRNTNKKEEN